MNAVKEKDRIIRWIHAYMGDNGTENTPIIVGLSGGKDSTITAAICVEALGKDRVIGISMPDKDQKNSKAKAVAKKLGIRLITHKISKITETLKKDLQKVTENISTVVQWNMPPRVRMTVLYMYANALGGRVANTSNMSETYVGYDTRWGDQCGDFSLFQNYTASEIKQIGTALKLPKSLVEVPPSDDLCGKTDEERWGFSYNDLDNYLRGGEIAADIKDKIEAMHKAGLYKAAAVNLPGPEYFPEGSRNTKI